MAKSNTKKVAKKAVKFSKDSVEGTSIRTIKGRQRKIETAGTTLVSLWYEQGKELLELQTILECSQRELEVHTGVKRTAINTYVNIASDPRLGEPETAKLLGKFTQKDLIKLGKLDEDDFNKSVEDGKVVGVEVVEPTEPKAPKAEKAKAEKAEAKWATELKAIIDEANGDYDVAKADIQAYFELDVEIEEEVSILDKAIAKTGSDDIAVQAETIGLKKGVFKTALADGTMSKTTIKKINEYLAS